MGKRRRYETGSAELDRDIERLVTRAVSEFGHAEGGDYVRELVVSSLRLLKDATSIGDLKLLNASLKELRHAFRVFAPWEEARKVAVFGSARTQPSHADWRAAHDFSERMAREGWMIITGAGPGVMRAANGGAGRKASFGVNIRLPYEQAANDVIAGDPKLINFRYFFTRKLLFVKEAHAIALFPGGFGTHDEGFEALTLVQTGKSQMLPIVFVDAPGGSYWRDWEEYVRTHLVARKLVGERDLSLFLVTDDVDTAVEEVLGFYSNYHSSRYVGENLVLRVRNAPSGDECRALEQDFRELLAGGGIQVRGALPEENGEAPGLARVVFPFNRRDNAHLRELIDRLNALVPEPASPPGRAAPRELPPEALPPSAERAEEAFED
jgi:uncharacterized protein (TIGR00730 family)